MAKMIQFEGRKAGCQECEANLTDWLDGALDAAEQARFAQHIATCATCSERVGEAQRGAAWLEMLRTPRPEPPVALLERILAQTSATGLPGFGTDEPEWTGYGLPAAYGLPAMAGPSGPGVPQPNMLPANVISLGARLAANQRFQALRYNLLQPRLAMTAAMAFFSVALTLNLTGVRLNEVHASNLSPTGLRQTFYDTSAKAARYYGNLKVVYVMESKLEDIRRSREDDDPVHPDGGTDRGNAPDSAPAAKPSPDQRPAQPEKKQTPGPGTSERVTPQPVQSRPHFVPVVQPVNSDNITKTNRSPQIAESQPLVAAKREFSSVVGE